MLRFREKGSKSREIPVSHDLKVWLDAYINAAHLHALPAWKDPENGNLRAPLFPTAVWREKKTLECADDKQSCLPDDAAATGAGRVADEPFAALISCGGYYGFARTEN